MEPLNFRKEWFNFVARTRKKLFRRDKSTTHKTAMAEASKSWAKEKQKLIRKHAREAKRKQTQPEIVPTDT